MKPNELNKRHVRFCKEYIACKFNGTQAAINSGYSKKGARAEASRLLTNVNIQNYLSKLLIKDEKETDITKERVLEEIRRLAFVDIRKLFDKNGNLKPVHELDDSTAAALSGIEICEEKTIKTSKVISRTKKVKMYDKTKSLEMLAKHLKIYTDAPGIKINFGKKKISFS